MTDDETSRNSRVILAIGAEAFAKFKNFKVGLIGLSPTGCEIIKNLALTGIGHISVFDSSLTTNFDLGSNFFSRPKDLNKPRSSALIPRFRRVNSRSEVTSISEITDEWILSLNSLIVAELRPFSELIRLSNLCHSNGIQFQYVVTIGAVSLLFEDFGDFDCCNLNGLPPKTIHITNVTLHETPLVTVDVSDEETQIYETETFSFQSVPGLPQLEGQTAQIVEIIREEMRVKSFRIRLDTSSFPKYDHTAEVGTLVEIKKVVHLSHISLSEKLAIVVPRLNNEIRLRNLIFELSKFWDANGRPPKLLSQEDAAAIAASVPDLPNAEKFALFVGVEYSPNVGVIGGAAAQEAMKFCNQTFLPSFSQFLIVDHSRIVAWTDPPTLTGTRDDVLIALVGPEVASRIRNSSALIVGIGAIGCEYARHAALFGISRIAMADDDSIEPSNLTRQFLFRDKHRGLPKAVVGRSAILKANPSLNPESILAFPERFDERSVVRFPRGVNLAFSAVDSVPGRHFIARYAKNRSIPMINGGMQSTQADFGYTIPWLTQTFAMKNVEVPNALACTLRNFPTKPIHLIQWTQNEFVRLFQTAPENALAAIRGGAEASVRSAGIRLLLKTPATVQDCVQWAYSKFTRILEYLPTAQLASHPPDSLYWQGHPSRPVPFDINNITHIQFVKSAAILKAGIHGIEINENEVRDLIGKCQKPPYKLDSLIEDKTVRIVDHAALSQQFEERKAELLQRAEHLKIIQFDKDNELHLDFIEGYVRARGVQRRIPLHHIGRLELMKLVGSIAPTLATTTAMVGGGAFAGVPMLFTDSLKGKRVPYNGAIRLDGLQYDLFLPGAASAKTKFGVSERLFGPWEVIDIKGNPKVEDVVAKIKEEHNVVITDLLSVDKLLPLVEGTKKGIVEFIRELTPVIDDIYDLDVFATNENGEDVEFPPLKVWVIEE
jgi:ubiquitin-activating enzyme E1